MSVQRRVNVGKACTSGRCVAGINFSSYISEGPAIFMESLGAITNKGRAEGRVLVSPKDARKRIREEMDLGFVNVETVTDVKR